MLKNIEISEGKVMGYLTCVFFLILYYGVCAYAVFSNQNVQFKNSKFSMLHIFILAITVAGSIFLTAFWIMENKFVYYWDYSGYWSSALTQAEFVFHSTFFDVVKQVLHSINNDDYNVFLPTLTALPMRWFGSDFPQYVLIVQFMFLIPSAFVQAMLACKLTENNNLGLENSFCLALVLFLLFPANYYAMYRGYIDIAAILPITIAIYNLVDYDFQKISFKKNSAIAIMLVLSWISRRYVVHFVIGYVAALFIKATSIVLEKKFKKCYKRIIANFSCIGGISLAILLLFFRTFVFRALLSDYTNMYSAYDAPLEYKIQELIASFGYVAWLSVIITGILCFINQRGRTNYISLLTILIVETVFFWRIQAMGVHHRMMLNIPVFSLLIMILNFLPPKTEIVRKPFTTGIVILCIAFFGVNFYQSFMPFSSGKETGTFFSEKYTPFVRNDIENLKTLDRYLHMLTDETQETIYVAASGPILNSDILRKINMPDTQDNLPTMYSTHDVDLRDGFPTNFLYADYVVTTDPIQTHLATGQEVVTYLAHGVNDSNSYIGCHYEIINEFNLDDGVTAKVYKKVSEWTEADFIRLRKYYNELYPDYTEIFGNRVK